MLSSSNIDVKPLVNKMFEYDDRVRVFEIAASPPLADVKIQGVMPQSGK
jgi:D-xylulose reductase